MIEAIIVMMAALVAAIYWTTRLQRRVFILTRRWRKVEQRLNSAKLTLADTKQDNEYLDNEVEFLKSVLLDIAKGEADAWIGEDGGLRVKKRITGNTQIH